MKKWLGLAVLAISVTNVWAQHVLGAQPMENGI